MKEECQSLTSLKKGEVQKNCNKTDQNVNRNVTSTMLVWFFK